MSLLRSEPRFQLLTSLTNSLLMLSLLVTLLLPQTYAGGVSMVVIGAADTFFGALYARNFSGGKLRWNALLPWQVKGTRSRRRREVKPAIAAGYSMVGVLGLFDGVVHLIHD